MSSHHSPQEIRKNLTHPVIDGDGHWVEYTPVFAEKMRKVAGDLGADGFLEVAAPHSRHAGADAGAAQAARRRDGRGIGAGKRSTPATARPR